MFLSKPHMTPGRAVVARAFSNWLVGLMILVAPGLATAQGDAGFPDGQDGGADGGAVLLGDASGPCVTGAEQICCSGGDGALPGEPWTVRPVPPNQPVSPTNPGEALAKVAMDAPVVVRFGQGSTRAYLLDCTDGDLASLVKLERVEWDESGAETRVPIVGTARFLSEDKDLLVWEPALQAREIWSGEFEQAYWDRDAVYQGQVLACDGHCERALSFQAGTDIDRYPPIFDGLIQVAVSDGEEDGAVRIDATLGATADDGQRASVDLLLYQTRGAGLMFPVLRGRGPAGPGVRRYSFSLTAQETREPVCLQAVAVDGVGRVQEDSNELCLDPRTEVYFFGLCSVGHPGLETRQGPGTRTLRVGGPAALLCLLALLLWRRCARPSPRVPGQPGTQ